MSSETEPSEFESTEPLAAGTSTQPDDQPEASPKKDFTPAMLCHLMSLLLFIGIPLGNIIGPLIVWLTKKDGDPFVDETGKEVLNFQISMTIYGAVCIALSFVIIGLILLPILIILNVVYTIIAALKANDGILYRYPCSIRFFK